MRIRWRRVQGGLVPAGGPRKRLGAARWRRCSRLALPAPLARCRPTRQRNLQLGRRRQLGGRAACRRQWRPQWRRSCGAPAPHGAGGGARGGDARPPGVPGQPLSGVGGMASRCFPSAQLASLALCLHPPWPSHPGWVAPGWPPAGLASHRVPTTAWLTPPTSRPAPAPTPKGGQLLRGAGPGLGRRRGGHPARQAHAVAGHAPRQDWRRAGGGRGLQPGHRGGPRPRPRPHPSWLGAWPGARP